MCRGSCASEALPYDCRMSDIQPAQPEQVLVTLGNLSFSEHWVVSQGGPHELQGTQLSVADSLSYHSAIPVWAIVLAIIFFPLGLLFLLVREQRTVPAQLLTISKGTFVQTVSLPHSEENLGKIAYLRTLIAARENN